jgi:hypothetical protein
MLQLSMNFFQYKTDIITKTWNLGLFHLNLPGEDGTPLIFRPPTSRILITPSTGVREDVD